MTKNGKLKNKVLITVVTHNNPVLLNKLIDSIYKFDAGYEYDLLILDAGSDNKQQLLYLDKLSQKHRIQTVIDNRVEVSYNTAWNENKDYKYYFFFHDDCCVREDYWLTRFIDRMDSGYYENDIKDTHLRHLPIGKVSIGNQFWRSYSSVKGFPVQCLYLKPVLEILYPGKVPTIFKLTDCDRVLFSNECLTTTNGIRNLKEFADLQTTDVSKFNEICDILNTYLTYPDVGMYPVEMYPPGQCWSKLTLVTEYLDSIDPLVKGWRGVGLYDDGYLEQIHGFDVPQQHLCITHYGAPNYLTFIAKYFNVDQKAIKQRLKNKAFLLQCDKIYEQYLKNNER